MTPRLGFLSKRYKPGTGQLDPQTAEVFVLFSLFSYADTSKTIKIPFGTQVIGDHIGETWSQVAAFGLAFPDASDPKVMTRVDSPGEVSDVEMQDLFSTTQSPTADCHVRIGGVTGTSGINPDCHGASLTTHIASKASGYFDNVWLWVADYDIDDPDLNGANNTMISTLLSLAKRKTNLTSHDPSPNIHMCGPWPPSRKPGDDVAIRNVFQACCLLPPFEGIVGKIAGNPSYGYDGGDFDGGYTPKVSLSGEARTSISSRILRDTSPVGYILFA
ncbi:hypothetical protein GGS23DRAFT_597332 [Durotheca rogersii]|uniref:uncharacterized protein n=1 Tax=Durotheca rogersii TaxID=419775 RepID=UPI00221E9611|nr:uncharacterized protein GGS23DRAFT_597332 [Durotheca rogersii]KAI5862531.1 hypothetical protein GGS23DRAFT_597332 [Durotheca rogersii]